MYNTISMLTYHPRTMYGNRTEFDRIPKQTANPTGFCPQRIR